MSEDLYHKVTISEVMSKKRTILLIFIIALIIRICFIFTVEPIPLETDSKHYDALGTRLAEGKGYINSSGQPTAFRPPIYPLFLGATYKIAGHNLTWVRIVQAMLGAGICVLAYLIGAVIFDRMIANLTGYLCCLYLPLIVNTSQILTETLFTFLLLLGILLIISRNNYVNLVISGIVLGLALLTRPFLIFFLPFLYGWLFLQNKFGRLRGVAMLSIGIFLVLSPWILRNYCRLNSFVPFANVGGITLYNSYVVPQKGFSFNSLEGVDDEYYTIRNETDRSRFLTGKAVEYIRENPAKTAKLAIVKVLLFIYPFDGYWYSLSFGSKYNMFWGIVLCFSLLGIGFSLCDNDINKKVIYLLFLSYLIGVMVFYGSPRFRVPIEPLLICFAANGIVRFSKKNLFAFSMIVFVNIMLFAIFRYVKMEEVFHFFRKWM